MTIPPQHDSLSLSLYIAITKIAFYLCNDEYLTFTSTTDTIGV